MFSVNLNGYLFEYATEAILDEFELCQVHHVELSKQHAERKLPYLLSSVFKVSYPLKEILAIVLNLSDHFALHLDQVFDEDFQTPVKVS